MPRIDPPAAVADNVFLIRLPLPLPDLRDINCYAIPDSDAVTLIDPGWATAESELTLIESLAMLGFGLHDVNRVLVTHAHWDHYTQALVLRKDFGCEVMLGREERHSISAFLRLPDPYPEQAAALRRAGAAELAAIIDTLELAPYEAGVSTGNPDRWLDDGEQFEIDGSTLSVHTTPGHTRGHVVFELADSAVTFTGDHVLPRITPSLAFERAPEATPLRSYLASLRGMLDRPDSLMLPAHGDTDRTVHARVHELFDHHGERLTEIASLVARGERTAAEVAAAMRWTRKNRSITELAPLHQTTAILEVATHLDFLVDAGEMHVRETTDTARYRIVQ